MSAPRMSELILHYSRPYTYSFRPLSPPLTIHCSQKEGFSKEVRVGVCHGYMHAINSLGSSYVDKNLSALIAHLLNMLAASRLPPTHSECVCARKCVSFLLGKMFHDNLDEGGFLKAIKVRGSHFFTWVPHFVSGCVLGFVH